MKSSKILTVGILGSSGRMGQEVKAHCELMGFSVIVELSSKNFSQYIKSKDPKTPDVWIDFSKPQVLDAFLDFLSKNPAPLVSGTTGLSEVHFAKLKKLAKKTSVFWAPNMSVGVALVAKMLEVFETYSEFDFQIDEAHHKHKKDKPSGTAIFLQNKLLDVVGRRNIPEPLSIRGGGIYGVHRIQAMSDEEVISVEHTALNRRVFAKGAVWAGQKILHYKSGYFEMKDILKV